jgi:tetratricopeptide (TPR) repeat protein
MNNQESPFAQIAFSAPREDGINFLKIAATNLTDLNYLDHVAQIQSKIKDYDNCIETLKKELTITKDPEAVYAIRSNLATHYNKVNDPRSALEHLNLNTVMQPSPDLEMEKALAYYFLGDYESSESIMRDLATQDLPEQFRDRILYNLAIYEIENGNFKKGYYQYIEKGHRIHIWPTQQLAMIPLWKGEVETGKTILIHGEGGIGDEIIGVRFMNHIRKLGMRPVWKTNNEQLKTVFNRNGYETITEYNELESSNTSQVMAMYLPVYLDLDTMWDGAYLKPCEEHIEKWKQFLPGGRKLAVRWAGNTHYEQDLHRSIPVDKISNLKYNGTKINIQLEETVDWAFNPNINTIEDTLAILSLSEDGVVTSCTSVAHMAAAMGVKTIVCPPIAYYYVWAEGVNWYGDHVSVIKQTNWKDWDAVFDRVQEKIDGKQL